MTIATCAFFMQWVGVLSRKRIKLHVLIMNLSIALDLSLVLGLEIKRNAVETVIQHKLHGLQIYHVLFSSVATFLYVPMLILGWSLYKNTDWITRKRSVWVSCHRNLGILTIGFRTLGWLMMWSLI